MLIMQFTGTILSLLFKLFRAQSLNLSLGALVLPDVNFYAHCRNFRRTAENFKSTAYNCERFEPRSHFTSRLSLIVRVNVVLNRTVAVDSD